MTDVQTYEPLLAFIEAQLSQPVERQETEDGTLAFTGGDPPEVIVRLTPRSVVVAEYSLRWQGPYTAVVKPIQIGSVRWGRGSEGDVMRAVGALITVARNIRLSKFRPARFAGSGTVPSSCTPTGICQGCAERELGVVH
jgi:hypothetical protein